MKTEIETAIKMLIKKLPGENRGDEALKLTQAALNLAHTAQVMKQVDSDKK